MPFSSTIASTRGNTSRTLSLATINFEVVAPVTLILFCLLVYFPVFSLDFQMHWDDKWVVFNRFTENGFISNNIWSILTRYYNGQYSPVNQFYYTLIYSLFGYNSGAFHAAGLILHIANTLLAYYFIKRILLISGKFKFQSAQRIAYLTAFLLGIHPFMVEAVCWISASKILLYAMFYLIALHCYLSYLTKRTLGFYLLTLLFFIFSFGAKEQAVTLPIAMLLVDYASGLQLKFKKISLEKLPFLALALIFGIVTMLSQASNSLGALSNHPTFPFYQRIVFASYAVIEYFTKCLVPLKLSYLYPFPTVLGEAVPVRFLIYPFVILFLLFAFWNFIKKPWIFFGLAFFIIHLLLVVHLIPMGRYSIIADRYVYIAAIGIFFLLSLLLEQQMSKAIKYKKSIITLLIGYVFCLGAYANQRTNIWHDSDTLKKDLRYLLHQRKLQNPTEQ